MKYLKTGLFAAVAAVTAAGSAAASAQAPDPAAEALAQCFRLSTNGKDRILTARWFLAAMASSPQLQDVAQLDPQVKEQSDIGMAALFTRLLTVDCLAESRVVFSGNDGNDGVRHAGEVLGEIAMQELFGSDASASALGDYVKYLDLEAFDVLRE